MKKSEKTRTVFYATKDGKDLLAFDSYREALDFIQDKFDVLGLPPSYDIIESIIIGNSSYPEMLNRKYHEGDTVEDKPQATSSQIRRRYLVQYQTPEMNAGWLSVDYSTPLSINAYNHAKNLIKAGIAKATRIKQVGIYS
jgi:hypothetical protein